MNKRMTFAVLTGLAVWLQMISPCPADTDTGTDTAALPETPAQRAARLEWWRDARFGMFIHWGLYSEAAGFWDGRPSSGAGEWLMNDMRVPRDQYATLTNRFDPEKFDADQWVKTAHAAGMKYLVITSKHHDGFCLFRTQATDYNIVDATPWHQDPLRALSAACRRHGVKFCVYYSIMDWHSPDQTPAKPDPDHPTYNPTGFAPGKKADYVQYLKTELKELITQYHPGLIWFDGQWMDGWTDEDGRALYRYLRELDPGLIVNNRVKGAGDYETPEQFIPPNGLPGRDWETCMTMNGTWGFKKDDHDWKSTRTLIRNLVDIASKGGNYLLNVGPTGEGLIPEASVERLNEIGQWMKINGAAIYGTTASPFARQLPWGRCTVKTDGRHTTLYLHVFDWPADGKLLVPGLKNKIDKAYLLAGGKRLAVDSGESGITLSLPTTAPDPISSTVVVKFSGAPEVARGAGILPDKEGRIVLSAREATLHGNTLTYEFQADGSRDNIGYWTSSGDWVDWSFTVTRPGRYQVSAWTAGPAPTAFDLSVAGQTIHGTVPGTGDFGEFKQEKLGAIEIPTSGAVTLAVHPVQAGWQPMNLKSILLEPVSP